ncbi:MAG: hypothetical protein V4541_07975 [Bacteroidota bacterium]
MCLKYKDSFNCDLRRLRDSANRQNILHLLFYFSFPYGGCNADEYSPNQKFNRNTPINSNAKEIKKLPHKAAGSAIKIAISGDTQRSYKESRDFVNLINSRDDIVTINNGQLNAQEITF